MFNCKQKQNLTTFLYKLCLVQWSVMAVYALIIIGQPVTVTG